MVSKPVIDDETIRLLLKRVAGFYGCAKDNRECKGGCLETIEGAKQIVSIETTDVATALAFAAGLSISIGFLSSPLSKLSDRLDPTPGNQVAVVIAEALRKAGRITDADLDKACDEFLKRLEGGGGKNKEQNESEDKTFDFMEVGDFPLSN